MDFPAPVSIHAPVISTASWESVGPAHGIIGGPGWTSWPSANRAVYIPFKFYTPYLIRAFFSTNAVDVTGNIDMGLYTLGGARLVSTGSVAMSGTHICQVFTLGTAYLVGPGSYYLAMACDSTSMSFNAWNWSAEAGKGLGIHTQASAFALPSAATFATAASGYIPICGVSNRISGVV